MRDRGVRVRTATRDGDDRRHAVRARDQQAWWDWAWARQMARLRVLLGDGKGDGA